MATLTVMARQYQCKVWLTLLAMLLMPITGAAQPRSPAYLEVEDSWQQRQTVVQRRAFDPVAVLTLAPGVLVADPFSKGLCLIAGMGYFFSPHWGWQIFDVMAIKQIPTAFQAALNTATSYSLTIPQMLLSFSSALLIKPTYGKITSRRGGLLHSESFLVLGPSFSVLQKKLAWGGRVGLGARFFLSQHWATQIAVNIILLRPVNNSQPLHNVLVQIGLDYWIPRK